MPLPTTRPLLISIALVAMSWALPAQAVDPVHYKDTIEHPHKPSWEDEDGHHQHRSKHTVMNWGDGDGKYDANKVWTDENLNYVGDTTHGSHGFIRETAANAPDYMFMDSFSKADGDKAKPLIDAAFAAWSAIASDRADLIMGLLFSPTTDSKGAEIRVHWATDADFPDLAGNIAVFLPTAQPREGGGSFYDLVFKRDHSWFFGGTGTTDADKKSFTDSTKADDFYTVALHEVGHVVGLQHQTDVDDVMFTFAGSRIRVKDGGVFRGLSGDDIDGARDLYSIPVPEAESAWLALVGLALVWRMRSRQSSKRGHTLAATA